MIEVHHKGVLIAVNNSYYSEVIPLPSTMLCFNIEFIAVRTTIVSKLLRIPPESELFISIIVKL